jgi:histidine ammonia-lyase
MGTIAARSLRKIVDDAKVCSAIFAMALCQGFYLANERGLKIDLNRTAEVPLAAAQKHFVKLVQDRPLDKEIYGMTEAIFGRSGFGDMLDVCE